LHFDISELYIRYFRKECDVFPFDVKNINHQIDSIFNKKRIERKDRQLKYDLETCHESKLQYQSIWYKDIKKELLELDNFSDTIQKIWLY
jgi:hypothetical protein